MYGRNFYTGIAGTLDSCRVESVIRTAAWTIDAVMLANLLAQVRGLTLRDKRLD